VCHAVWGGPGGFFADMGVLDFAGGIVVHITAGIAALVACIMVSGTWRAAGGQLAGSWRAAGGQLAGSCKISTSGCLQGAEALSSLPA